MKYEIICSGLV